MPWRISKISGLKSKAWMDSELLEEITDLKKGLSTIQRWHSGGRNKIECSSSEEGDLLA